MQISILKILYLKNIHENCFILSAFTDVALKNAKILDHDYSIFVLRAINGSVADHIIIHLQMWQLNVLMYKVHKQYYVLMVHKIIYMQQECNLQILHLKIIVVH